MNLNVEIVREHIHGICAGAAAIGANSVLAEGLRFEISMNTVTTVRPGGTSLSKTSKAKSQDRIRLDKRPAQ